MTSRFAVLFLILTAGLWAQHDSAQKNDPAQIDKPYVLLISLDGFRFDYAEREQAKNLLAFRDAGSYAGSLMPVWPSTTFPNHLSIITGCYPARHGIVENNFYDPVRQQSYVFKRKENSADGSWYQAEPLWVVAEKQGMRTASMFWPASDAEIQGVRPSHWYNYDDSIPYSQRVQQVVDWFSMPVDQRPHLVTLYFSLTDQAGHKHGPESEELKSAVQAIDRTIGDLMGKLDALHLPINTVIVSDHGMQPILREPIDLTAISDLSQFTIGPSGGQVMLYSSDQELVTRTLNQLRAAHDPRFIAYRRGELPERLHYVNNQRIGDIVVIAQTAQLIRSRPLTPGQTPGGLDAATHGFDPQKFPLMQGIFYAKGPHIKSGQRVATFENIHIFPLLAKILGLTIPPAIDGSYAVLEPIYQPSPAAPKSTATH